MSMCTYVSRWGVMDLRITWFEGPYLWKSINDCLEFKKKKELLIFKNWPQTSQNPGQIQHDTFIDGLTLDTIISLTSWQHNLWSPLHMIANVIISLATESNSKTIDLFLRATDRKNKFYYWWKSLLGFCLFVCSITTCIWKCHWTH